MIKAESKESVLKEIEEDQETMEVGSRPLSGRRNPLRTATKFSGPAEQGAIGRRGGTDPSDGQSARRVIAFLALRHSAGPAFCFLYYRRSSIISPQGKV